MKNNKRQCSPTMIFSYHININSFKDNGGGLNNGLYPTSVYDDNGFDKYGYNRDHIDREGISELEYINCPMLFSDVLEKWSKKSIFDHSEEKLRYEAIMSKFKCIESYLEIRNKTLKENPTLEMFMNEQDRQIINAISHAITNIQLVEINLTKDEK